MDRGRCHRGLRPRGRARFDPSRCLWSGRICRGERGAPVVLAAVGSHNAGGGPWRALFGRANGGMIVHLGVVVVAVALAAASSYGQRTQLVLKPGQSIRYDGHIFTYVGSKRFSLPNKSGEIATVLVDGRPSNRPSASSPEARGSVPRPWTRRSARTPISPSPTSTSRRMARRPSTSSSSPWCCGSGRRGHHGFRGSARRDPQSAPARFQGQARSARDIRADRFAGDPTC